MQRSALSKAARISAVLAASSAGVGLAALAGGTTAAHADPAAASARVGVGSDTIQDVFNAFAGSEPYQGSGAGTSLATRFYTPLTSAPNTNKLIDAIGISSWDAIPFGGSAANPGSITAKFGGPAFDRPNGSSNGVAALRASIGTGSNAAGPNFWQASTGSATGTPVNVSGQIDFARSSRGPNTTGTNLTFIPFARDGVTYAYLLPSGDPNASAIAALTSAQLTAIYSSSSATATVGSDTVKGCLPQAGSGTRSFWETAINVPDATAGAEATAAGCNSSEENGANSFYTFASGAESSNANTVYIIPFSAGSWAAQANGVAADNSATGRANGVTLGDPDGLGGSPLNGTAPSLTPNTTYYQSPQYGRDLFVVAPTNKVSGLSADRALQGLFGGPSSAICSTGAQATVNKFGFDSLNSNDTTKKTDGSVYAPLCGDLTDQGSN